MTNDVAILQAVKALRKISSENVSSEKKALFDPASKPIYLQVSLKKVPKIKSCRKIKVSLPHSLVKDSSNVCLIVGDTDKVNRKADIDSDILYYKNLLKEKEVSKVTEVMTLRQLRTEYRPFEAKDKLLDCYQFFLVDNRITGCLPRVLGKYSFIKRKFPIQLNINAKDLKRQIDKALSEKYFFLSGRGNSITSEVAYLDMKSYEIIENVTACIEKLFLDLPGGAENVLGLYLRTAKSISIPIYMSFGNPNVVNFNEEKVKEDVEAEELSTLLNTKVKVFKDGTIRHLKETPGEDEGAVDDGLIPNKNDDKDQIRQDIKVERGEAEDFNIESSGREDFEDWETEIDKSKTSEKESGKNRKKMKSSLGLKKLNKKRKMSSSDNSSKEFGTLCNAEFESDLEVLDCVSMPNENVDKNLIREQNELSDSEDKGAEVKKRRKCEKESGKKKKKKSVLISSQ